jgi:hypothetical protein
MRSVDSTYRFFDFVILFLVFIFQMKDWGTVSEESLSCCYFNAFFRSTVVFRIQDRCVWPTANNSSSRLQCLCFEWFSCTFLEKGRRWLRMIWINYSGKHSGTRNPW